MSEIEPISLATARELIDFSGGSPELDFLALPQLEGAVALQNIIADPEIGIAYLADEVGMGKTYIALGVVALMRFFNPALRVLYIAPKNNVREKWVKDYKAFIAANYKKTDGINKGADGKPAVPFLECRSMTELLQALCTGQSGDFFICASSFSFALDDEETGLFEKLSLIEKYVPALGQPGQEKRRGTTLKEAVKEEYAKALNYMLPLFDLVVVDEAHNLKNGIESSHRNRMLARILGAWREKGSAYRCRVKNVLLLSATPFDRDLGHLENQLKLFGRSHLMAGATAENYEAVLSRFMVRRLNSIELGPQKKRHTRNMYRTEHRSGRVAEIRLKSDEQKLFTALVQKKVSDVLDRDFGGKYQTGMLASFESYLPAGTLKNAEFDGNSDEKKLQEAPDRDVVERLVASFRESFVRLPPHPKMDEVSRLLHRETFEGAGKKQLVFVRRVKSVPDLKAKLDERYDHWLRQYLARHLEGCDACGMLEEVWSKYEQIARKEDREIFEGEAVPNQDGDDDQPPQNDNFFTWFFRGATHPEIAPILSGASITTPEEARKQMTQKSSTWSLLFEFNWRDFFARFVDERVLEEIVAAAPALKRIQAKGEAWRDYMACQIGFLEAVAGMGPPRAAEAAELVLRHCYGGGLESLKQPVGELSPEKVSEYLRQQTFFSVLELPGHESLAAEIFPLLGKLSLLFGDGSSGEKGALLRQLEVHRELLATLVRIDHVFIDLYIARLKQAGRQVQPQVLEEFIRHLGAQKANRLSSRRILTGLAEQLPLILKLNFSDIGDVPRSELRRYIVKQISPLSPVIGASGETSSNRSSQARKFRMPGYPLVLVSTDVFQEGEDLHTFCDRVTHYGISASPIALEQKVGRVDRVHSLAQRNLLRHPRSIKKHYIKVFYPHIRETIEYQQMFNVALGLNQFIESLHRVGGHSLKIGDTQDADQVVTGKIPKQIVAELKSPFPARPLLSGEPSQLAMIGTMRDRFDVNLSHLRTLVARVEEKYRGRGIAYRIDEERAAEQAVELRLRSSRTSGRLLLSASAKVPGDEGLLRVDSDWKSLLRTLKSLESGASYRMIAGEEEKGGYRLYRNVEMYVEEPECLQQEEVENLLERVMAEGKLPGVDGQQGVTVAQLFRDAKGFLSANARRFGSTSFRFDSRSGEVTCFFNPRGQERKHLVKARIQKGYLVLTARIATVTRVSKIGRSNPESLVRMTLLRNVNVDLVELHLSKQCELIGRVTHPLEHLQSVEFLTCLQTLAVECDQMEYVLMKNDIF